jgi:cytoskeleton protein RodZ
MQRNDGDAGARAGSVEPSANLGKILAQARAARGLSLDELAVELRLEARVLRALEECRFAELGPPVFAKGYLKQYGNRLGLAYPDLLAEYYRIVEPQEVTLAPPRKIKLRDERQITVWIVAALAIALLGVFLMVWWLDEPEIRAPSLPAGAEPGGADVDIAVPLEPEDREPPASEAEAPPADPSPSAEEAPAAATAEAPAEEQFSAPPFAAEPTGPLVTLDIEFREDSWLEVTDAVGTRLFYGLGEAGARSIVTGEAPLDVFLGNAGGVTLIVEGSPFDVPRRARQGNLARFSISGLAD